MLLLLNDRRSIARNHEELITNLGVTRQKARDSYFREKERQGNKVRQTISEQTDIAAKLSSELDALRTSAHLSKEHIHNAIKNITKAALSKATKRKYREELQSEFDKETQNAKEAKDRDAKRITALERVNGQVQERAKRAENNNESANTRLKTLEEAKRTADTRVRSLGEGNTLLRSAVQRLEGEKTLASGQFESRVQTLKDELQIEKKEAQVARDGFEARVKELEQQDAVD